MFSFFKTANLKMIKKNAAANMLEAVIHVGFDLGNDRNLLMHAVESHCSELDNSEVIAMGSDVLAVAVGIALADHTTHLGVRGYEAEINNRKWIDFSEFLIRKATQRSTSWDDRRREIMYQARKDADRVISDVEDFKQGALF